MAIYRSIQTCFWTDANIADDFTPEDRYFYLYLFTNPHTNLCGCYEISKKQAALETGYSIETIDNLLVRFEQVLNVIRFNKQTKEVLIIKWHKYNWTSSDKFRKPLGKEIDSIKCPDFKQYLSDIYNGIDTVSIPYQYGMDTTVTDTVTNTISDSLSNSNSKSKDIDIPKEKSIKENPRYFPDDDLLEKTFADFREMRKKIKKPMTDRAITLLLNKLGKLSSDTSEQVKILEQSIMNCWQDIYELKDQQRGKQTKIQSIEDVWANVH